MLSMLKLLEYAESGILAQLENLNKQRVYLEKCADTAKVTGCITDGLAHVDKQMERLKADLADVEKRAKLLDDEDDTPYTDYIYDEEEPGLEYGELEQILEILRVHRKALEMQIKRFCGKPLDASIGMGNFSEVLVEMSLRVHKCKKVEATVKAILDYLDQENEYESL